MKGTTAFNLWSYLILSLVALGLIRTLIESPLYVLVPLLIIGVIFLLYKYPPRWLLKITSTPYQPRREQGKLNKKRKRRTFRVIDGNKKPF
ncbi:hypothetical protein [Hazenella coriacea]|uniref:Uncharacterized protein n=1 Tax=Hazenella coriacea TaxID=1179467 RepID=A0A4V2UVM6_9BACL|nr:hypothetical protein [Hazenella coriacea]TCS96407.1 hypothetical protein EDD58_10138 [Hazenella coriacea]